MNPLHPQKMQGCSLLVEWGGSRDPAGNWRILPRCPRCIHARSTGGWGCQGEGADTAWLEDLLLQQELQVLRVSLVVTLSCAGRPQWWQGDRELWDH